MIVKENFVIYYDYIYFVKIIQIITVNTSILICLKNN